MCVPTQQSMMSFKKKSYICWLTDGILMFLKKDEEVVPVLNKGFLGAAGMDLVSLTIMAAAASFRRALSLFILVMMAGSFPDAHSMVSKTLKAGLVSLLVSTACYEGRELSQLYQIAQNHLPHLPLF